MMMNRLTATTNRATTTTTKFVQQQQQQVVVAKTYLFCHQQQQQHFLLFNHSAATTDIIMIKRRRLLLSVVSIATARTQQQQRTFTTSLSSINSSTSVQKTIATVDLIDEVEQQNEIEIAKIMNHYYTNQQPVILKGMAKHIPAIKKWKDWDYIIDTVEQHQPNLLCEVEIGHYNNNNNQGQQEQEKKLSIPFTAYFDYLKIWKHTMESGQIVQDHELLYLAQNDVPIGLLKDIEIPSFCSDPTYNVGHGKLYSTMMWIGPKGCLSPLHFDPLDNLFIQINGRKKVTLIDSVVDASTLYGGIEYNQQNNTSSIVDIENPNYIKYPNLLNIPSKIETGELYPGDALYIPSRWWHAVRSLDFSISVNIWWR